MPCPTCGALTDLELAQRSLDDYRGIACKLKYRNVPIEFFSIYDLRALVAKFHTELMKERATAYG